MAVVRIGGRDMAVPDFTGRKALRAGHIVRDILKAWPELQLDLARFRRDYRRENVLELDRATARVRYGPRLVVDADGEPARYPDTITVGGVEQPHPQAGQVITTPDQLAHMTEADWQASQQTLRMPELPKREEEFLALFPKAFEHAEEQVKQLMALAVVTGAELREAAVTGGDEQIKLMLAARGDDLLDDGTLPELINLLVTAAEMVQEQVTDQLDTLSDRTRPLLRLLGLGQQAQTPPPPAAEPTTPSSSEPKPDSSTPSPEPTAGMSERPSTELVSSSSSS